MKRDIKVMCYGGGVNSVAALIELTKQGVIFDFILFADPGKEKRKSYEYTAMMNEWCKAHGQPEINTVKQVNAKGEFIGLYRDCMSINALPSIVYGYKTCSIKYKKYPQDKFLNNNDSVIEAWRNGFKVIKYIGYDAEERHRTESNYSDNKYDFVYPLVDWGWERMSCIERIINEGLPLPPKSSCTFCPSMKPWEIIELYMYNPKEFYDAISMERNAAGNLGSIQGLGRDFSWWDLIAAYRYLNWIRRYNSMAVIKNEKMKKLMEKALRSIEKKDIKKKRNKHLQTSPSDLIQELFQTKSEISCNCYDG